MIPCRTARGYHRYDDGRRVVKTGNSKQIIDFILQLELYPRVQGSNSVTTFRLILSLHLASPAGRLFCVVKLLGRMIAARVSQLLGLYAVFCHST